MVEYKDLINIIQITMEVGVSDVQVSSDLQLVIKKELT